MPQRPLENNTRWRERSKKRDRLKSRRSKKLLLLPRRPRMPLERLNSMPRKPHLLRIRRLLKLKPPR